MRNAAAAIAAAAEITTRSMVDRVNRFGLDVPQLLQAAAGVGEVIHNRMTIRIPRRIDAVLNLGGH